MPSCDHIMVEDEYIDMDVSSATALFNGKSSPPRSREFEFQMSTNPPERETATAPADELFYKGKLLPLHLPPRIQMVQKLLQGSADSDAEAIAAYSTTKPTPATTPTTTTAPSEPCNQEEYTHQSQSRKSWSKKLKLIGQSSLCLRLKASKAYLKSLFTTRSKDRSDGHSKEERDDTYAQLPKERRRTADAGAATLLRSIEREKLLEEECMHRNSFSGAINCHLMSRSSAEVSSCSSSSSSSFSSVNSNRLYGSHVLNRSNSVNSEMESSIQGAIAYCKKSQITAGERVGDAGLSSLSTPRVVAGCENQESPGLRRG